MNNKKSLSFNLIDGINSNRNFRTFGLTSSDVQVRLELIKRIVLNEIVRRTLSVLFFTVNGMYQFDTVPYQERIVLNGHTNIVIYLNVT